MRFSVTQGVIIMVAAFALLVLGFTQHKPMRVPVQQPPTQAGVPALGLEGWETYRNEEFRFEVMYPEGFYQKAYSLVDDKNEILLNVSFASKKDYDCGDEFIQIQVTPQESRLYRFDDYKDYQKSEALLGGEGTVAYGADGGAPCPRYGEDNSRQILPSLSTVTRKGDNYYIIDVLYSQDKLEDIFREVTSSFKFIE